MRLLYLLFILLFTSCGIQWQYTTLNHAAQIDGIYRSSDYKVDTISSVSGLEWKLKNDFNFRYDFAQYAMNQPYSWYWNNPRLEGIWRPYNRFDIYFYSNWFWNDWAFNYPFHHTWGWNSWHNWNRPYNYYGWNRPYTPWNNWYQGPFNYPGYNVVWNSSRRNTNVAYINGNRTSTRAVVNNTNRRTTPSVNVNNNNRTIKVNKPRVNYNSKPRINTPRVRVNTPSRPTPTIRTTPSRPTRSSNNTITRINSRRKN